MFRKFRKKKKFIRDAYIRGIAVCVENPKFRWQPVKSIKLVRMKCIVSQSKNKFKNPTPLFDHK